MIFNEQQQRIYEKINKFSSKESKKSKILIMGPSGSGKTTVVTKSLNQHINVCFCAFTNKATKILKDMITNICKSDNFEFYTIHSLLKLEPNTIESTTKNKQLTSYKGIYDYKNLIEKIKTLTSHTSKQAKGDTPYTPRQQEQATKRQLCQSLEMQPHHNASIKKVRNQGKIKDAKDTKKEEKDDILIFNYNYKNIEHLVKFDIIVIDECSTISKELYIYIESTIRYIRDKFNHNIKIIFLGDYYQLPPINEHKSIVFDLAIREKWSIYKLSKIMRSKTTQTDKINKKFLKFIDKKIKGNKITPKNISSPYKVLKQKYFNEDNQLYFNDQKTFFNEYINLKTEDKIIITYSNANCDKTNSIIQNMIYKKNDLQFDGEKIIKYPSTYKFTPIMIWFKNNDRVVLQSPIEIPTFNIKNINEMGENIYCVSADEVSTTKNKLYNGDIFIVKEQKKIKIRTVLNTLNHIYYDIPPTFSGQLLKIYNLTDGDRESTIYTQIINIDTLELEKTRRKIKKYMHYNDYIGYMNLFKRNFTTLKRGNCLTCYKIQGSEFTHVFINLISFWYCLLSDKRKNNDNARLLFSAFYTAATRSSNRLYLYYF